VKYPKLSTAVSQLVLSVNQEYAEVESKQLLKHNDEVAIIPAISGG
jgi:molybdopterin converting factor small subunit